MEFHWWFVPLAVFLSGVVIGWNIGTTPETGMFPMNPVFGFIMFLIFSGCSLALVIGHLL